MYALEPTANPDEQEVQTPATGTHDHPGIMVSKLPLLLFTR